MVDVPGIVVVVELSGTVVVVDVPGIVVVVELSGTVVVVDVPGIVVVEVVVVEGDVVVVVVVVDAMVVVVVVDGAGCVAVVVVLVVVVVVGAGPEYSTDWTSEMAASLEAPSSCKAATAASYTGPDPALSRIPRKRTSATPFAAYNDLVTELVGLRDEHVQSVLLAGRELGRVADAVRFLVFFLVPLMLIIVYRRGARRREEAMSMEDLRLEPAVTEVANVFAMRGIAVGVRVPDVIVTADRMGLRHLILNLVSNAARHGGDEISVEAVMREGVVLMRVIDDGPGVPEDIEPYLFNRYLHGGGRALLSGSVGLGTAVAAAYAESFGGTIEYIRANDRTIFEVRLPAVVSHAEPALV